MAIRDFSYKNSISFIGCLNCSESGVSTFGLQLHGRYSHKLHYQYLDLYFPDTGYLEFLSLIKLHMWDYLEAWCSRGACIYTFEKAHPQFHLQQLGWSFSWRWYME